MATDILRGVSGRSVGSGSSGRGVKQKHVSREEGLEGGKMSRLLRPSDYKFKIESYTMGAVPS